MIEKYIKIINAILTIIAIILFYYIINLNLIVFR